MQQKYFTRQDKAQNTEASSHFLSLPSTDREICTLTIENMVSAHLGIISLNNNFEIVLAND